MLSTVLPTRNGISTLTAIATAASTKDTVTPRRYGRRNRRSRTKVLTQPFTLQSEASTSGPEVGPRPSTAVQLHALGLDAEQDALLALLAKRVLVLAEVLLRERVDVVVGALVRVIDDATADLRVLVRVLVVDHGHRHPRVPSHVPRPLPALGGVQHDVPAVDAGPDHLHVRRAVLVERGQGHEVRGLEQ